MKPEQTIELSIAVNGDVTAIYQDEAQAVYAVLGTAIIRRCSRVEPYPGGLGWQVDLRPTGGPLDSTAYSTRALALAAEEKWIRRNRL